MKINRRFVLFETLLLAAAIALTSATPQLRAGTGSCGGQTFTLPFTDVQGNPFFCAIALAFFSGLTNGTTATTYSPTAPVPREQMAAFVGRTLDQSLKRGSQRAALGQWWTSRNPAAHDKTTVLSAPRHLVSDGEHIYVCGGGNGISKVRASTGEVIANVATIVDNPDGLLVAGGYLWLVGERSDISSFVIETKSLDNLSFGVNRSISGTAPTGLTFDGENIWTANSGDGSTGGSLTRFNISTYAQTTYTSGFNFTSPHSILYDGASLWVTVPSADVVRRVNPATGAVEQNVAVGNYPKSLVFDGTNLWVTCLSNQVYVIRAVGALQGTVLATLSGNGLSEPVQAAFDGERILVTNYVGDSVSLWKASDLTPIGTFPLPPTSTPYGVCSDGTKFWISLLYEDQIVSF